MQAGILFVILLIIGVLLVFVGRKVDDNTKIILIILGVVIILIALFGIFTSLL